MATMKQIRSNITGPLIFESIMLSELVQLSALLVIFAVTVS